MERFTHDIYTLLPVAAIIAVWAYVWVMELTAGDGLFGFLSVWLHKVLPWLIAKPLVGCQQCHAGQCAFWAYLLTHLYAYNPFVHISFVAITILITILITACLNKLRS